MKSGLALLLLSLTLASCTPTRWQMQAPCPGSTNAELISSLTALVANEGMDVLIVDSKVGILQARGTDDGGIFSSDKMVHWNFSIRNDTIFAFAKKSSESINSSASSATGTVTTTANVKEEYLTNENAGKREGWFWNVYNGVVGLCEDQVIVFVKK